MKIIHFNKKFISDFELQYSKGISIETDKKIKLLKLKKNFQIQEF